MAATVWRAPGRVNLVGEHTDYNGGFVLPLAIAQGCTATARPLAEPIVRCSSAQRPGRVDTPLAELRPGRPDGWAAYVAGSVWALRSAGRAVSGVAVHIDSDIPAGSGLSSSAAVVCSVTAAVADQFGAALDPDELVRLGRVAENDFAGAPTGGMDQLASVKCRAGHVLLCDMRTLGTEAVPFDLAAAGLALVVADTRAPHRHADGEYRARREACEAAARALGVPSLRDARLADVERLTDDTLRRRARHVVTENARVLDTALLLRDGLVASIGPLLSASHASMREEFEITVAEVDTAVESAMDAGALGARMTGGGFGGCVIALVEAAAVPAVVASMEEAFARKGYRAPVSFTATAGPGAHRVTT